MFFGWRMAYDSYRGSVRQLESTTRSLDGARKSAYNNRLLLMESRSQFQRLQDEMAGDVDRLQDQLTEADGEVDQLRSNIIALTRQAYDDREKYDHSMKTSDARIKELERKLGASCLEELVLSEAHAESERLSTAAEVLHRKYQAATSGENLVKLVVVDHKRTINFFTNEVAKMKLSHKDEVDRLRLELSQAKGVGTSPVLVGDVVTRVLHQEPGTPFVTGGFASPAMASPEARSDQSRGSAHVHGVDVRVRDGPAMASPEARGDQVRGSVQDRGVGAGMMLSPQRESGSQKTDLGALEGGAHGLQALAQSVIAGKTVYLQGAKISPAQVASFVDHKRKQLRSGVFLIDHLDADIDASAIPGPKR
jgi:hypothetical protein